MTLPTPTLAAEIYRCPRCGAVTVVLFGTVRRARPHRCPPRPSAGAALPVPAPYAPVAAVAA